MKVSDIPEHTVITFLSLYLKRCKIMNSFAFLQFRSYSKGQNISVLKENFDYRKEHLIKTLEKARYSIKNDLSPLVLFEDEESDFEDPPPAEDDLKESLLSNKKKKYQSKEDLLTAVAIAM